MARVLQQRSLLILPNPPRVILCKAGVKAMSTSFLTSPLPLIGQSHTELPRLVYGTAWKKDRTADLVYQALRAGFRAVDTAAQPKHYQEKLVGDGIRRAINEGVVKREDIFIQTKYTPLSGQDPQNMPYDGKLSVADQVHASVASSLSNLSDGSEEPYLDCVLIHSPLPKLQGTVIAWNTLSEYVQQGKIRHLGIANVSMPVLTYLATSVDIKPSVVQNRFYADSRYEIQLRRFCRSQGLVFQAFWTLTANPALLRSEPVRDLARMAAVSVQVALYALVVGLRKVTVLDGTTNQERMLEDLKGLERVGRWAEEEQGREFWKMTLDSFKEIINEWEDE